MLRQLLKTTVLDLSILWCHGTTDKEIPIAYGENAVAFLKDSLAVPETQLQYLAYEGLKHTTRNDELSDVASWLHARFQR